MIYFDNQRSMVNFINGIEKDIMETFESYKSMEGIQIGHLEDLYHELEMLFHQRNETKVLLGGTLFFIGLACCASSHAFLFGADLYKIRVGLYRGVCGVYYLC